MVEREVGALEDSLLGPEGEKKKTLVRKFEDIHVYWDRTGSRGIHVYSLYIHAHFHYELSPPTETWCNLVY
jgi:hypothetical protein